MFVWNYPPVGVFSIYFHYGTHTILTQSRFVYSYFNLGSRWGWVVKWLTPRSGLFTTGKETRYSLYRRLGGPQVQCERVRKISPPPGFHPRTVRLVAIRYTTYTLPAHKSVYRASVNGSSCTVQAVTVWDSLHTAAFVTESDQMALRYEMPRLHVAALATRSAGQRLSTLSQTTLKPLDSDYSCHLPTLQGTATKFFLFASPPSSILGLTWFRLSGF